MEQRIIRHRSRPFHFTLTRILEFEPDIQSCPPDHADLSAVCPDCGCTMVYRGIARLRSGRLVHHYECVHSHREVISVSIVVGD